MRHLILGITLLFPFLANAIAPLEYDLIRTAETPGFFAVTIFPSQESTPLSERFIFIKNFAQTDIDIYQPVLDFLSEIGAIILPKIPEKTENMRLVSLGDKINGEINFHSTNNNSLESFEQFVVEELQPTFLRNINAEFGGNISAVSQTENNLTGDGGITFIGKFEKDIKTRMAINGENEVNGIHFEFPLDIHDTSLSKSPIAKELPNLWEDMQPKPLISQNNLIDAFPWIIAALGLLILVVIFIRNTKRKYYEFIEAQDRLQEELPWQQITKEENKISNPFEIK